MNRATGPKSYDKRTKKAVFGCSVPGTRGHVRKRKVVTVTGWDNLLEQLKIFRDSVLHPEETTVLPGDIPTISDYVTSTWESFSSGPSRNKKTNQQALLEHHVTPFLGNVRLDRVTIAHLADFVRVMQRKTHGKEQKPYSASTINTCLHLIRTILKHAWRRRILTYYPLRERLPLLHEPVVQNELTTDERDTFLASFDNQQGFRAHFTTTALARRKDRKHQPPESAERLCRLRLRTPPFEQTPLRARALHRPATLRP